jgi:chain length determinant protein EpsF
MSIKQMLRAVWARKWLVLVLFLIFASVGTAYVLLKPKTYTAEATLVVEVRPDPLMGNIATPASIATQVEIIRSEKVATRVVKMLGLEKSPNAVQQWREATDAKIPLDRYFAGLLLNGLSVEPSRGSNVILISFLSRDPVFAAAAANGFAKAALEVAIEMRVEPARQSATWFENQTKSLRVQLEEAQAKLSRFQQENGIVVTDERLDQETARLNSLEAQLVGAETERVSATAMQRTSGAEQSPDVQQSGAVQGIKAQLNVAQAKLSEISSVVGPSHPQRVQLDAQIAQLRQQLSSEMRRVSGGTYAIGRASVQKVEEVRALINEQKKKVLSMRAERDQIAVLQRDVETAQKAYEGVSQRMGLVNMESQSNQSSLRLLTEAVEALEPSIKKVVVGIIGSILGGLLVAMALAVGLEALDRKVRATDDLAGMYGIPVIGVLRPGDSKQPIYRQLAAGTNKPPPLHRPSLPMPGGH